LKQDISNSTLKRIAFIGNYLPRQCGYTIGSDNDTINIYYGAVDTCIGLATSSIKKMLEWLEENKEYEMTIINIIIQEVISNHKEKVK